MSGNDVTGYTGDGYTVVIDGTDLDKRAKAIKGAHPHVWDMREHLLRSLVPPEAFGTIPNAGNVHKNLSDWLGHRLAEIEAMGVSVADFAARVQAAHDLAVQAEPDTVVASRIPAPLDPATAGG